jgi:glycosyltransferase involved in cell wall biosynthesis
VSSWLSESYIGVQSSHWEGFGLTAVEMMAAGLPVIASNVEGLKQVVDGAGELFTCGDERELAQIVNLLLNDEDMYKEMQQKCLSRAKLYDIHATVEAYLKIYKEVSV